MAKFLSKLVTAFKRSLGETPTDFNDDNLPVGDELNFYATEAYNSIRANLNFSSFGHAGAKYIGITSADPQEGKSTTSINISYAMAKYGKKTILIEADLRKPGIRKKLKIIDEKGFTDLVVGQNKFEEVAQNGILNKNLTIITAGTLPPNPSELLGSTSCQQLLKSFSDQFDYVIIDLPPIGIVSDALTLASTLDGYIFVGRLNYSQKKRVAKAIAILKNAGARILGFVVTGFKSKKAGYGKYNKYYKKYGYYYYGNPYKEKSEKTENEK